MIGTSDTGRSRGARRKGANARRWMRAVGGGLILGLALGAGSCSRGGSPAVGRAREDVQRLRTTVIRYKTRYGAYPMNEAELRRMYSEFLGVPFPLLDPWGGHYRYLPPSAAPPGNLFVLWSPGPDGSDGTGDDVGFPESSHRILTSAHCGKAIP